MKKEWKNRKFEVVGKERGTSLKEKGLVKGGEKLMEWRGKKCRKEVQNK